MSSAFPAFKLGKNTQRSSLTGAFKKTKRICTVFLNILQKDVASNYLKRTAPKFITCQTKNVLS